MRATGVPFAEPVASTSGVAAASSQRDLVVDRLSVFYGGVQAVHDLSFRVPAGAAVAIIGANGAGKSSVLKAIFGLVPRRTGAIRYGAVDLMRAQPHQVVWAGLGYVPEGRRVFAGLTVEQNLLLGAYRSRWDSVVRDRVSEMCGLFPKLQRLRRSLAGGLSGGEQQMLAIGRAMMSKPSLIVLDEPSMGLAPVMVDEVVDVLARLRETGVGMLLVEQNAELTFGIADTCIVLETGRTVLTGTSAELRSDPRVRRVYLGL